MSLKITHKVETSDGKTNTVEIEVPLTAVGAASGAVSSDTAAISTLTKQVFKANTASATTVKSKNKGSMLLPILTPPPAEPKVINLVVSNWDGRVYRIQAATRDTIETVKQRACQFFGLRPEECELYQGPGVHGLGRLRDARWDWYCKRGAPSTYFQVVAKCLMLPELRDDLHRGEAIELATSRFSGT